MESAHCCRSTRPTSSSATAARRASCGASSGSPRYERTGVPAARSGSVRSQAPKASPSSGMRANPGGDAMAASSGRTSAPSRSHG